MGAYLDKILQRGGVGGEGYKRLRGGMNRNQVFPKKKRQ